MRYITAVVLVLIFVLGCGTRKKEDLGDSSEPLEVRAYKGAKDAQKKEKELQQQNQAIEDEADQKKPYRRPDGGFGLNDTRDTVDQANQDSKDAEQAEQDTNQ